MTVPKEQAGRRSGLREWLRNGEEGARESKEGGRKRVLRYRLQTYTDSSWRGGGSISGGAVTWHVRDGRRFAVSDG